LARPVGQMTLLDDLRAAELSVVLRHLPPAPARLLELGAGTGWQSSLLSKQGYEVASVDVDVMPAAETGYAPVLPIDGVRLPFASGSFDVVFSSNVLEHVVDLPGLLREVDRVLGADGRAVHLMPTPTWRVAAMSMFYLTVPKRAAHWALARRANAARTLEVVAPDTSATALTLRELVVRAMLREPPHGEFPSAIAEISAYRAGAWRKRLAGRVVLDEPAGVFYTGHLSMPSLPMAWRRRFAGVVGSGCRIYVCERAC
ncbi:MAG TPA: class I SAM-dependent methyltransferase, partial [Acidimicrobiia bacterium]|nr:class I SAM-dependent methyltransferase [Acidimicrobiia bacterium]